MGVPSIALGSPLASSIIDLLARKDLPMSQSHSLQFDPIIVHIRPNLSFCRCVSPLLCSILLTIRLSVPYLPRSVLLRRFYMHTQLFYRILKTGAASLGHTDLLFKVMSDNTVS